MNFNNLKGYCLQEKLTGQVFPYFYYTVPFPFNATNHPIDRFFFFILNTKTPRYGNMFPIIDDYQIVKPCSPTKEIFLANHPSNIYKILRHSLNRVLSKVTQNINQLFSSLSQSQQLDLKEILKNCHSHDRKSFTKIILNRYEELTQITEWDFTNGNQTTLPLPSSFPKNPTPLKFLVDWNSL